MSLVAGLPDPDLGELVAAAVIPAPGAEPTEEGLRGGAAGAPVQLQDPAPHRAHHARRRSADGHRQDAAVRSGGDDRGPSGRRLGRGGAMITLTNANVFDGRAMLPGRHDVTVDGKRIVSVSEHTASSSGEVVDVGGMTVLPGLITLSPAPRLLQVRDRLRRAARQGAAAGRDDGHRRAHVPSAARERLHRLRRRVLRARHRRAAQDRHRPGHHPRPTHPCLRPPHRHDRRHEQPTALLEGLRDPRRRPRRRRTRRAPQAGPAGDRPRGADDQDLRRRRSRSAQPHDTEHVTGRDRHDRRDRARARSEGPGPRRQPGDDPRVHRARRRRHRPRRRDRRRDHREDGRGRHVLGAQPRLPLEPPRGRLRQAVRGRTRAVRARADDAAPGASRPASASSSATTTAACSARCSPTIRSTTRSATTGASSPSTPPSTG